MLVSIGDGVLMTVDYENAIQCANRLACGGYETIRLMVRGKPQEIPVPEWAVSVSFREIGIGILPIFHKATKAE